MRCRIRFGTVVRLFFVQCCLFFAVTDAPAADPNPQNKIIVAGPPAGVSNALVHMANQSEQQSLPWTVEFKLWTTPDQLRAIALEGRLTLSLCPPMSQLIFTTEAQSCNCSTLLNGGHSGSCRAMPQKRI